MGRRWLLFGVCLLAFSTAMWGQLPVVPGTDKPEHPLFALPRIGFSAERYCHRRGAE